MPAYGPYETSRELASGHGSVVYSAHKGGEPKDNYAIKVFSLESYIGDEETRSDLNQLVEGVEQTFTRSVEIQKQASQSSRHVAPILDVGREPGSAWYATKLYQRTVSKILEGRVALGREWFFHIVSSVVRGALDIKRVCGRSHGKIQPSNVLIGAGQKATDAEVVLADPLPGDTAEAERYELADLNAIGQIIFQLVRRREIEDAADHSILPLVASAEWTSIFGKDTDAWLSLCNRLLDPNLSLDVFDLQKLDAELAKLRPKPPVTGKMIAMAAAVVVLLAAAGFYFISTAGKGTLTISSNPPGAQIQLNGQALPGRTPIKLTLSRGSYELRAEYAGLEPQTATVDLQSGRLEKMMVFPHGVVVLGSDPPGASVLLGGTNLLVDARPVVTPYTLPAIKPGALTFQLDLKGFLTTNLPINVQPGSTNRLAVTLTRPPVGQVVVEFDSIPRGARIELDAKPFATTLESKSLAPGSYKVTAHYRDIWPVKETNLVVQPNQAARVQFYFERGKIDMESDPSGANVFFGNRLVAITPTNNLLWPTGMVSFRFEKPGFEPTNVTVNLSQDGDSADLNPRLTSTNGIILLTVEPAPAVVIDATTRAELMRTTPGQAQEIMLPPGRHSFIIQAPGYQPLPTNLVFVSKQRASVTVRLPAELIPVAFSADPPGVVLYDAAGRPVGALEQVSGLPAGNYSFIAKQVRYPTLGWITNDVSVVKGQPNPFVFKFPYTTLVITSSPPNLKVFEVLERGRRELVGVTPTNRNFLKPGPIILEFVKSDGSETNQHQFNLLAGIARVGTYFRPPKPLPLTNSIGMVFEWINQQGTNGGYWVGKFEVTQSQYQTIMGANPSSFKNGNPATLPVETVSLEDARRFCRQLTDRDKDLLKGASYEGWTYALPTQAQWYFYVAGAPLATAITSDKAKRFNATNIGSLGPNDYELHDVRGNVWEWCAEGVFRGSAYDSFKGFLLKMTIDDVLKLNPNMPAAANGGFRCVIIPPPSQ
jgi:hypothetical protein